MGHYCRICGRLRPNEKFSGHGHRIHICRKCARRPKHIRDAVLQRQEIEGFLQQSNISNKNIARLKRLAASDNPETVILAQLVLDVARVKRHKRKRFHILRQKRPDLLCKLSEVGLIEPFDYFPPVWSEDYLDDWHRNEFENEAPFEVYEPPPEEAPTDWDTYDNGDCVEVYESPPEEELTDRDSWYDADGVEVCEPPPEEAPTDWDTYDNGDCVEVYESPPEETELDGWGIDILEPGYSSEPF